jgi:hypothetical protein
LPEDELESEIDKRSTRYNDEMARRKAEESARDVEYTETVSEADTTTAEENETGDDESQQKEKYRISIDLLSTLDKAREIAAAIKSEYGQDPSIREIRLIHNRDE